MSSSDASITSTAGETVTNAVKSPLWMSLYVLSTTTPAVNENTVSGVPPTNNPRPLRGMSDNAEYWVNDGGDAFTFKFPATIDFQGQFDRTGPYFNLPRTGLDLPALKKMRAQFEIRPLDIHTHDTLPEEAIKCSSSVMDMLNVLHGEAQDARNALLAPTLYPRDNPFWHSYGAGENECFSVVLTTDTLIGNITHAGRASVPRLRWCDIGKGDSMQSPSKARAAAMAGAPPGGAKSSTTTLQEHPPLSDLPDPLGRYASLITQYNLREATVVAPNIRDGDGHLIRPHEYNTKLATGDMVFVECQLKLWTIAPNRRENALPEDRNGSRRYQVMLKSMKVLPDASITAAEFANYWTDAKGKRKATDCAEGSSATKKPLNDEASDGDEEDEDEEEFPLKDGHAMQVTEY
ncbi:uncharacterized protein EDB91DRAFT_1337905 [Suillus paluster]|uniref:uncharacterized protein n=1 Tax=Suillus paluster TaxID=48578 RepID=UPI001B85BAA2|nr:uncharacterized protein EDB91DRAFT_1337905 [Suillus paluster]KAG1734445.1 hypothetical protein EDB91DRAFT_1337905 [Suillus paluster]